jgi:hypothetical protein
MSQTTDILRHLTKGRTLTPLEALSKFKCFRLAARVEELRKRGHPIDSEIVRVRGARVARYRMGRS